MAKDNLIDVIESLLEADMTKDDPIKNPQEEEKEDEMEEATQNSVNAKNQKADQEKQQTSSDTQGVLGKDGTAVDAGGDKDVGGSKGDNASDASSDTQGVAGDAKDTGVLDAGGDDDKGKLKEAEEHDEEDEMEEEAVPGSDDATAKPKSDKESPDTQKVAGDAKDTGVLDAGGDQDKGKLKEAEDHDEEEMAEADHDEEEEMAEAKKMEKEGNAVAVKAAAAVKDGKDEFELDGKKMPVTMSKDTADKIKTEEAEEDEAEEMEENKGVAGDTKDTGVLDAGGDKDEGKLKEADEEDHDEEEMAEDKGDMDGDGKDEDDSKEYMDAKDKAIKKAIAKEEEKDEMKEAEEHDEEEDLDEDFKSKAAVIFEAAVGEKVSVIREELENEYEDKLAEEVKVMNEKVSEYVDYAVQEWIKENSLEIKYSLRTEIAENFIRGLKGLFEESYIEIPEEDVSVVDELTETVESYKEQLEETSLELETMKQEILEMRRSKIVEEVSEGLTQTQALRLERLAENVEADDVEEFKFKIEELKEGYFDPNLNESPIGSLTEEVFGGNEAIYEDNNTTVSQYAKFLSKTVLK